MTVVFADFETWPIQRRPHYPPRPVGLALYAADQAPVYMAFGHDTGNTASEGAARAVLLRLWSDPGVELCFHNAKFDLAVAMERWQLPELPWQRVHDTMFLSFLCDPHSRSIGLKALAAEHLDMPPDERDDVAGWVQEHKRELTARWPELGTVKKGKEGAWIFAAPGDLVAPYAIGDVVRTAGLFAKMLPLVERHGMAAAYDRERQLLPILMRNEREGMRTDMALLQQDVERYGAAFAFVEDWLRRILRASGLNFDADQDVAAVLIERGVVPESNFARTAPTNRSPNGQLSMSKDNLLPELFIGPSGREVASALGYRNRLKTCLDMFMRPWLAQAEVSNGYITTNWNQTRGYGDGGTRTGRPSTNEHNFLNISKSFEGRDDQYEHPAFLSLPPLPLCRQYIVPDEGEVFLHRDFSGQELRVFAHFEQGALWEQYQANPALDVHAYVGGEFMRAAGREIERTKVKVMNFQSLYGGGIPALQAKLRISTAEAREMKNFHNQALPGRQILNDEIKRVTRRGDPIRTWGGRLYFVEPPGPDGRSKDYKLINYLVQGSAADLTKQAIIEWDAAQREIPPWVKPARFLISVYDEIDLSAESEFAPQHMRLLKDVMERPRLSVPMLSDGKWGEAWGRLQKYKDE